MGEIINRLLLFNEEIDENFPQKKMELLTSVIEELKNAKEQDKYECICSTLESDFYNKSFVSEFFKEEKFLQMLYNILDESKDNPKKINAVMKLLIRINENILKNIDGRCTTPVELENPMEIINMFSNNYALEDNNKEVDADMEQIVKNMIVNLINSLEKNQFSFLDDLDDYSTKESNEFNSTYLRPQKKMGMKKLAQIELFRTILDIIVNAYGKCNLEEQALKIVNIIKEKKIFPKIHKLFFDFPFCNLYQAYYNQIIDIVLNELSPKELVETVFEKEEKNLIQNLIDNSLNNMKFNFNSKNIAFHPNFSFEVSLLTKIFTSNNEHLKNIIKENKNLEVFNKIIGDEVKKIFDQKLLLSDNEIQFSAHEETEEKKPMVFFGSKTFMDLLEEDIGIYKIYLENGDYEKALDEKIKKAQLEQEKLEKELEEEKKKEEEYFVAEEEEQEDKKADLKGSVNLMGQDDDEENNKNDEEKEENNNENVGEEKVESSNEEETTEEEKEKKDFNEVNFWKPGIESNDDIMTAILHDLDD